MQPPCQATHAAICALPGNHALRGGASDLPLGCQEGLRGAARVASIESLTALLHDRSHARSDVLIPLAAALGLADSLEGGFMVGQDGLSFGVGARIIVGETHGVEAMR